MQVAATDTHNDLHHLLGSRLGIPPELLRVSWHLSAPHHPPFGNDPLWLNIVDNLDVQHDISVQRLEAPPQHDGVQQCDSCLFVRHTFYGYVQMAPGQWDAVVATCGPCGGMLSDPWDPTGSGTPRTQTSMPCTPRIGTTQAEQSRTRSPRRNLTGAVEVFQTEFDHGDPCVGRCLEHNFGMCTDNDEDMSTMTPPDYEIEESLCRDIDQMDDFYEAARLEAFTFSPTPLDEDMPAAAPDEQAVFCDEGGLFVGHN